MLVLLNEMLCDIVDFPAKFRLLTLHQILVGFTCDYCLLFSVRDRDI